MIIYTCTWRILNKQVPNMCPLDEGGIQSNIIARYGRICYVIVHRAPPAIQKQHMTTLN